jgi:hypothetical protein
MRQPTYKKNAAPHFAVQKVKGGNEDKKRERKK